MWQITCNFQGFIKEPRFYASRSNFILNLDSPKEGVEEPIYLDKLGGSRPIIYNEILARSKGGQITPQVFGVAQPPLNLTGVAEHLRTLGGFSTSPRVVRKPPSYFSFMFFCFLFSDFVLLFPIRFNLIHLAKNIFPIFFFSKLSIHNFKSFFFFGIHNFKNKTKKLYI
jgi:hypothetical protein